MSVITVRNITDQAIIGKELSASRVNWKRLRRLALHCGLLAFSVGGTAFYMNSGGFSGLLLRADGHVTRERVAVAPAFEGRVAEVFVRPGDHVEKGQKIAVVKSVAVGRTLADLEAEKARLTSKIAELEARRKVINLTLPLAKASADQVSGYLDDLRQAQANGLVVRKSMQEITTASLSAAEHEASLRAEQDTLTATLEADLTALAQATSASNELSTTYDNGALYASVSGDIGATVVPVGQALTTGNGAVADIFTGKDFVVAYIPETYVFDLAKGQTVEVKTKNETLTAQIDRVLPLAQNLTDDLQRPNRMIERGQLMRIELPENVLAIDQRVQVTGCLLSDCRVGLIQATIQKIASLYQTTRLALARRLSGKA